MYKNYLKHLIDFLLSLVAMPFVLLIIIVFAPIIWFDNHGPVFYVSARRGRDGKTYKMIKFRSMYVNSPNLKNADGSTFNSPDDLRVTNFGRIMRKTSLDEIPQIINVFLGQMSFIGPRPSLAISPFEETDPRTRKRFNVRPGITGYAQAYYRNSIGQYEKFRLDCEYVDNISFALDVKILFRTIMTVLNKDNVYVSAEISKEKITEERKTV